MLSIFLIIIILTPLELKSYAEILTICKTRKPYYYYSRIKTSTAILLVCISLAACNYRKSSHTATYLTDKGLLIQPFKHVPDVLGVLCSLR